MRIYMRETMGKTALHEAVRHAGKLWYGSNLEILREVRALIFH